jgi:hypothetical protein
VTQTLKVPKEKIRILIHLYSDMDIKKEQEYWSKITTIPIEHFYRPYIKHSLAKNITHKGTFGHGTCNVKINGADLARTVLASIKAMEDKYK